MTYGIAFEEDIVLARKAPQNSSSALRNGHLFKKEKPTEGEKPDSFPTIHKGRIKSDVEVRKPL